MKLRGAISPTALTAFAVLALAAPAIAQDPAQASAAPVPPTAASESPPWVLNLAAAAYLMPEERGFLQPTFRADRGRLHLEARYNYEDRESVSFFAGAGFGFGTKVEVTVVPMLGGLVGRTDGVVPALEADITVGPLEAYGEGEVVIDLENGSSSYFYMWSELSLWPTEWLRAGLVTQRTRVYQAERDIQRGPLVGVSWKSVEGTIYWFNPGSEDHLTVVSLAVSF